MVWCIFYSSFCGSELLLTLKNRLDFAASLVSCLWNTFHGVSLPFLLFSALISILSLAVLSDISSIWSSRNLSFSCLCLSILNLKTACQTQSRRVLDLYLSDQWNQICALFAENQEQVQVLVQAGQDHNNKAIRLITMKPWMTESMLWAKESPLEVAHLFRKPILQITRPTGLKI